ncbi:hypothetical protein [Sulfitobacter sp. 915]|uniref:hypothetical protein n=1 Tax=Sulfitobacter sp. 915 TaxID=3368558 RepID=UPI0037474D0A
MARIRSVHPGFFTDEDIVEVSALARLLLIGLGVEADDKGLFPWKAKTLKMRIYPADNVDMNALLSELEAEGLIKRYEFEGKHYGAIRNFRKHQRPKSPNDVHPCPPEILKYVGLEVTDSSNDNAPTDPIPPIGGDDEGQFPPKGENAIQMEDGGWRGSFSNEKQVDFADFWKAWPDKVSKQKAQEAWVQVPHDERAIAARTCAAWHKAWKGRNPKASNISPATFLLERRWTDEGFAAKAQASEGKALRFWADRINSGAFLAEGSVNPTTARALLDEGLVTAEKLKERGIAA